MYSSSRKVHFHISISLWTTYWYIWKWKFIYRETVFLFIFKLFFIFIHTIITKTIVSTVLLLNCFNCEHIIQQHNTLCFTHHVQFSPFSPLLVSSCQVSWLASGVSWSYHWNLLHSHWSISWLNWFRRISFGRLWCLWWGCACDLELLSMLLMLAVNEVLIKTWDRTSTCSSPCLI